MELLLLSAGKADKTWNGPKADRPLRTKGKRQAQKTGAWMACADLRPDRCLAEPGHRARVTAEKALKAGGWTASGIGTWDRSPVFPSMSERILLVARPKSVTALLRSFSLDLKVKPGTLIHLVLDKGQSKLGQIIDPDSLPDMFPYPAPNGSDRRERPAYYYTQSAAVPYRGSGPDTQILIVGSSSGRHWVVPKGIVEPGLSPAASAAVEAREEAGVLGHTTPAAIGAYTYQKWGADCHVTVYAMEVTHVIPTSAWEENHRVRRWVSKPEAMTLLNQPQMRAMVAAI